MALAVIGCANDSENEQPEESPSAEASVEPSEPAEADGESEEVVAAADEETEEPEQQLNERGNIPVAAGNPHGLLDIEADEPIVEWRSSEVTTDVQCTNWVGRDSGADLVSIDFEISVFENAQSLLGSEYSFPRGSFHVVDDSGQIVSDNPATTGTAINCIDSSQELSYTPLRDGQSASGTLVFEVPIDHGYLVMHDYYSGGYYEWEFDLR